jgi:hypothetical protein
MYAFRYAFAMVLTLAIFVAPAQAARPIVDLHKLDAYFALFASDSNVPWKNTAVRLDTYSSAPVQFTVYQVDPGDVLTAGSNARPRAIDTRGRKAIVSFRYRPPGGYQFQSNVVNVPLGSREGFFVVEARRGSVGEQVWINRTRIGLITKETPGELMIYGADLGTGRALAHMRVQLLAGGSFVDRMTDAHGIVRWNRSPRPIFALAQWGSGFAFTSLLPQAPLPNTVVGVRTDTAVVHAGGTVRVVGFARTRRNGVLEAATGNADVSMRLGGTLASQARVPLDAAGAFTTTLTAPANAVAGDYAVLAQVDGGVGGATVHVDADTNGLSLDATAACDASCDPNANVPVQITASRGNVPIHVVVVRSPHVFVGYTPETTPWATSKWMDTTLHADAQGHAMLQIPHPTDNLASTYGVRVESGGATADTRIVVPTANVAVRLRLETDEQTIGTPVNFDVYVNEVGNGKPLANADVVAQLTHGPSTQEQTLHLDANGHAHGVFNSPQLGTNLIVARVENQGRRAEDAGQTDVVPQATQDSSDSGSADAHVSLDRTVYHAKDDVHVEGSLHGASGDALVTLETALGAQADVVTAGNGRANARFTVKDAPGQLRIGAAFVRDGAIEWTSVPLQVDAPGRPEFVPLTLPRTQFAPGASATIALANTSAGPGTVVVRLSRGTPSGSALFDSAPALLAVGLAATEVSAPAGQTWHPWVNSTGDHPQVIGFERRGGAPADLTLAQAETQAVSWTVMRDNGAPLTVQLPEARGRYILSVLKISDDGRVTAASSTVEVQ